MLFWRIISLWILCASDKVGHETLMEKFANGKFTESLLVLTYCNGIDNFTFMKVLIGTCN